MNYKILTYTDFQLPAFEKKYTKVLAALQRGDFKTADVKKMPNTGFFRAKLDAEARLLFKFVQAGGERYLLLVEVLPHHDYAASRFLRGADIDEAKVQQLAAATAPTEGESEELRYLNPARQTLHFLDKFLSFDETQNSLLHLPPPLIIIGSAGSGKTALTLERLRMLRGHIAYVSLSPFLVENAQNLYYAGNYENEHQEIDFLSFADYLAGIRIPAGREIDFRAFEGFYNRYRSQTKVKEFYKLFEEFKGVITGAVVDAPYLSAEGYNNLGVKQSVFTPEQRPEVYALFEKYLAFLQNEGYYDSNILAHQYLAGVKPLYDYVIVDEVQDLTNIQLKVILAALKNPVGFVLCGDANQIVHPNFFSWSALKSMFYGADLDTDIIRILHTNYRNAAGVTHFANTLLRIKNLRFGSIDKESTHLIDSVSDKEGVVEFLEDKPQTKQELNRKTEHSTRHAVLVMNNEDKAEARKFFNTPLVFSIQEAKGLEYENIILVNFISNYEKEFRTIAEGIAPEDLAGELVYARARDKENKELDTYKFYINSLYVAMTRAVRNLYLVERATKHPLLPLLGLVKVAEKSALAESKSSMDDWKQEARRLEQQGKKEQSDAINQMVARQEKRVVLSDADVEALKAEALNGEKFNNQAKKKLLAWAAATSNHEVIHQLEALKFSDARKYFEKLDREFALFAADCRANRLDAKNKFIQQHGANFKDAAGVNGYFPAVNGAAVGSIRFLKNSGVPLVSLNEEGLTPLQYTILLYNLELAVQQDAKLRGKVHKPVVDTGAFGRVYNALKTHSLTIEADDRRIKVGSHTMEYFLFNFMVGVAPYVVLNNSKRVAARWSESEYLYPRLPAELERIQRGITMEEIMAFIELVPNSILPPYRRKRSYVNSILAKNEVDSTDPYNRGLFKRGARGIYRVNPALKLVSY